MALRRCAPGRAQPRPGKARSLTSRRPVMGYACMHSVIDDYSRVVYSEIHDDEKAIPLSACSSARCHGSAHEESG